MVKKVFFRYLYENVPELMSKKEIYPKGTVKQTNEFKDALELKNKVFEFIKETLVDTTEKAFKKAGFKKVEKYAGEYNDGKKYGVGVSKDEFNVIIAGKTKSMLEKHVILGAKIMISQINIDIDGRTGVLNMTYKNTEQASFRGFQNELKGFMVDEKLVFHVNPLAEFKKELKDKLTLFSEKEAAYITKTKVGVEDSTEKSTNSMVEENKEMKKLTIKNVISDSIEDFSKAFESYLGESKKENKKDKKKEEDDKLLLGDEEKNKKTAAERTKELEEISSAGSAGVSAVGGQPIDGTIGTVGPFKYAGNAFATTPYAQKGKKRAGIKKTKSEGDSFWTNVELNTGSGYVPKGMEHNYAMGQHGVEVNSKEEEKRAMTRNRYGIKGKINEGLDLTKRKFLSESENKELGINKRYIVTENLTPEQEKDRWKKLIDLKPYETIKSAENLNECGCVNAINSSNEVSRGEANAEAEQEFEKRNSDVESGEMLNGREVMNVAKPKSLTNVIFKVFKDDYLNENKVYLLDLTTGQYVLNPNYKSKK